MIKNIISAVLALCALGCTAQEPLKYTPYYHQRASLFDILPIEKTDIVFLGNSLTDGAEWNEIFGLANIKNRGISGDIIGGYADRIDPILKGKPKKLFILGGVNDVSHDLTADSIAQGMEQLLTRIQRECPDTRIYLQSLLPINNSFKRYKAIFGKEQTVRDCNTLFEKLASRLGITYIDLYPLFADEDGNLDTRYTNDGLHLLGPAYLIWADKIRPYVME